MGILGEMDSKLGWKLGILGEKWGFLGWKRGKWGFWVKWTKNGGGNGDFLGFFGPKCEFLGIFG